jgi:hypothetical protein
MIMTDNNDDGFEIRPYTTKELINFYGVSPYIFRGWLVPIQEQLGPRIGRTYTVRQVKVIVNEVGPPKAKYKED